MASLRKRGPVWYIRYTDEHGRSVERKGSRSKRVAQEMATEAESLANRIRQGLLDPAELAARKEAGRPLYEHLMDWFRSMYDRELSYNHIGLSHYRAMAVAAIIAGAGVAELHRRNMTADEKEVMQAALRARHASPSTTLQFYARATEADLRAAVESLTERNEK